MSHPEIVLLQGDITCINVDAIVNAANERMLGGGGVDGAIHRAAGRDLRQACERVAEVTPGVRCPTGEARITPAFNLSSKVVIHTVGPVYNHLSNQSTTSHHQALPAHPDPASALASAYRNSLTLAAKYLHRTVAFPAISCGVYGYPPDEAAKIAFQVVREQDWGTVEKVVFVLFEQNVFDTFDAVLSGRPVQQDPVAAARANLAQRMKDYKGPAFRDHRPGIDDDDDEGFDAILATMQGGD